MCTTGIERAAACLVAGAAYAFAFVQPGAAWIALPALATLAWCCLHAASARRAAWAGFAWGVPAFAGGLAWLHHALHGLGGTSLAITLPVMAFIVVVLAGYIAGVAWLAARVGTTPAQRALAFAPAWLVAEYARSHVFVGFPWMLAGDSQLDLPLGVLAPWAGVYGVGFALVAVAALLAWLLQGRGSHVTCAVVLAGIAAIAFEPAPPEARDTLRVTALRMPAERMRQDAWTWYREHTFALHGERDLIAWPEHVAPMHAHALRDDIDALARHATARGWSLAFGLPVQESDGNTFNTVLAVGHGFGRYDKRELVPFVEHTPYRLLIGRTLSLIENKIAGFTPGAVREAMVVGERTVATAICYEAAFPELVRDNVRAAGTPALLLMPSSDRWYGDGAGARQMQRMARMRARENGIAVVRIASEGASLFIDRAGRVVATLGAEGDGTLERAVAIDHAPTLWRRAGMAPIAVVAVLFLLAVSCVPLRRGDPHGVGEDPASECGPSDATMPPVSTPVLDLPTLRRGCAHCSLQQLCLPAGIGMQGLQQLDSIVRRRRPIARGESLFRTGDALSAVYVARDGAFKTISLSEEGEERVVGFHLPGELIGLDALGADIHRCDAVALTTANVCEVPFDQLADVASQVPGLQHQLLRVIGRSVGRDQDHLDMLARRQASERIALFLHGLAGRFRHIGQSDKQFKLPMSREDIARFLGLALETVSRGFTRLQEDGVIAVDGRRVEILDRAELDRLAHHPEAADARRRISG